MVSLLVIDDEEDRTEQVADWFAPLGYEVLRAHSGAEGLRQARDQQPSIIVLDVLMPGMDGHEVLVRLRRQPETEVIPVVLFTIWGEEDDRLLQELTRLGLQEGADYVMVKKWGMPTLEAAVQMLLSHRASSLVIRAGDHTLKLGEHCAEVWVDGQHKNLASIQSRILASLNECRGQPCHVEMISVALYGRKEDARLVYKAIRRLQERIEPDPKRSVFVVNVQGHGYKLVIGDQR
jgi:two-component system, OmpR family, alkaline phosphatase synthesis response regulator PhoP